MTPKMNLIYYKNILDLVMVDFFNDYNDSFEEVDGKYILGKSISKVKLKNILRDYFVKNLKKYVKPYNILLPNYYFIIGSCMPKDNLLYKYHLKDLYFPEKLEKLLNSDYLIKWYLKESDIKLNLVEINTILMSIFDEFFSSSRNIEKYIGKQYVKNMLFILHKKLCCYSMFKVIKHLYGNSNCVNIFKEKFIGLKLPLIAINDVICKYVHNKLIICNTEEFKTSVTEVKQFIDEYMTKK